ncbi:YmdB family metallophosphoesterase [Patescibacteria group bacterium]|nr:YmdB family metallophosphoesterase [Patescibacteria group bacterium]
MLKILVLGDVMGKIGRKALAKKLPVLKKKYSPDLVIANCENLAHGCGVTVKTLKEIFSAGVDFCTSGNHVWDKKGEFKKVIEDKELCKIIIRPANYKKIHRKAGEGYKIISAGGKKILIINLLGQAFMKAEAEKTHPPIPFLEKILDEYKRKKIDAILVDLHCEATSEKRAMGWAADGMVSVVWGTHTHTPTADAQILPNGTGYITDLGMTGARDSVIGEKKENIIEGMRRKKFKIKHDIPEKGPAVIQGIYAEIENNPSTPLRIGKTTKIKQILEETII